MGESVADSSEFEDKEEIVETTSSNAALEVSVSFGRFENDLLSWERFSTFSPNKYLEEVEKCAMPGSVAEKRAYFEAHYKKIAARKAELMDQEKEMEMENDDIESPRDHNSGDQKGNSFGTNFHYDTSNGQNSVEAADEEISWVSEASSNNIDEAYGDDGDSITIECQSLATGAKEESDGKSGSPKLDGSEKNCMVRDEETKVVHTIQDTKELPQSSESKTGNVKKIKDENLKSDPPKASRKITTANKEKDIPGAKKKPASPMTKTSQFSTARASKPAPTKAQQVSTPRALKSAPTKASQFSTPRVSKPTPTRTPQFSTPRASQPGSNPNAMAVSRPSVKKENVTSVPRKKSLPAVEGKRVTPKSMHMSLIIDPATPVRSDPASLTTVRKSLIMERMGDKDIVKRAFKSFQNNFNQLRSFSEERSSVVEQVSIGGADVTRVSRTMNTRKENGGSIGVSGTEKKSAKAAPSTFGSKSNERVPKHKDFSKKSDEKSSNQAERIRGQPKTKEQKEAEMKRLTRSLDLKASPMSALHRGKKISTGPSH